MGKTTQTSKPILNLQWKVGKFTVLKLVILNEMSVDIEFIGFKAYLNIREAIRFKGMVKRLL